MTEPHVPARGGTRGVLDRLRAADHRAVERLAGLNQSGRLRVWMLGATRAADGWGIIGIVPVALLMGGARAFAGICVGTVSGVTLSLIIQSLKAVFRRARPAGLAIEDPIGAPDRHAFPSGHSAHAFGAVVVGWWISPWLGLVLLPVAVAVAVSRMFFGLHYPTDVIVGGVLGCLITSGVIALASASGLVNWLIRISPIG
jgi:undecaprenyl-diphosphatase